jgi:FMN-dependent NADH-azoreductase
MLKNTILQIDSSGRSQGSLTRELSEKITNRLSNENSRVVKRDLNGGLPFVNEEWIGANFTDKDKRNQEQKDALKISDLLIAELQAADHIVIGSPIYNFNIPAVLKAWIDMIARAKVTFEYSENGPVGLLKNKKAYIAIASGGVPIGSEMDFSYKYLKHVLAFVGITDVSIIDASQSNQQLEELFGV